LQAHHKLSSERVTLREHACRRGRIVAVMGFDGGDKALHRWTDEFVSARIL
jgi:hypothetical protein